MKNLYVHVLYCCTFLRLLHGSQMPFDDASTRSLANTLPQSIFSDADRVVGRSFSLLARGSYHGFKFCHDYPRLVVFIVLVTPLFSSRWRSFLLQSISSSGWFIGNKVWQFIDSKLFGLVHQNLSNVQASLDVQHKELVGQSQQLVQLQTDLENVGEQLKGQMGKLEALLMSHSQQLQGLHEQECEVGKKIDTAHDIAAEHSLQLVGIRVQGDQIGGHVETLKGSLDALRQALCSLEVQVGGQHKDLVAAMEERFAALPDSQRRVLNEYTSQMSLRFDRLGTDVDEILRTIVLQHQQDRLKETYTMKLSAKT